MGGKGETAAVIDIGYFSLSLSGGEIGGLAGFVVMFRNDLDWFNTGVRSAKADRLLVV